MGRQALQRQIIERELTEHGHCTAWDMITKHHITRTAKYIHQLRIMGWRIETKYVTNKDTHTTFADYVLIERPERSVEIETTHRRDPS